MELDNLQRKRDELLRELALVEKRIKELSEQDTFRTDMEDERTTDALNAYNR